MAQNDENRDPEDLSEEASPFRLEEFRRKGRVAQSRELTGIIGLIASGLALWAMAPSIAEELSLYMKQVFQTDIAAKMDFQAAGVLKTTILKAGKIVVYLGLPVLATAFIIGIFGSYVQIGSIFSTEPLKPNLQKIDPINGFKKLVSMKQLWDGIRLVVRATAVVLAAYFLLKSEVMSSPKFILSDPGLLIASLGASTGKLFVSLVLILILFAVFDVWLQRWEYGKSVRLTKKEQKEEHKEHEGDPLIKARIRSVQREMARKRMMDDVKTADVVVTNPTHIAVALRYTNEEMNAPKVVAKGRDFIAQKIKKIAADNNIPIVENVPLARTIFKTVKLGKFIPRNLYKAVAEVLAYVYRLRGKKLE